MAIAEATISYKGRSVDMDDAGAAEGMIREIVQDSLGGAQSGKRPEGTRDQRRQQVHEAALRWIENQHGPDVEPDALYPTPGDGIFYDPFEEGERREFLPALDLSQIAESLIEECEGFEHLNRYSLLYLWKRKGGQRQGQPVLGKCMKASGPAKHLSTCTWIIWLAADWAANLQLTRKQIEAALHHELTHAGEKEIETTTPDGATQVKVVPAVRGHDCEMFSSEVERYGLWRMPLREVAPVFQQLRLFEEARR